MTSEQLTTTDRPVAGWYADPDGRAGTQRYWDGVAWTGHYHPPIPIIPPAPVIRAPRKSPIGAALLNLLICGCGAWYLGRVGRGFAWLGGALAAALLTGVGSILVLIAAMIDSYVLAGNMNAENGHPR